MHESISFQVFSNLMFQLDAYTTGIFPALMTSFGWFIRAFFILYLTIIGLGVMYGRFQDATREVITSMVILCILWASMFDSQIYYSWLIKPYIALVMDFGSFFLSHAQGDLFPSNGLFGIFSQIDVMFAKLIVTVVDLTPDVGFMSDLAIVLQAGFAVLIITLVYSTMYFAFIVLLAMGFFSIFILSVVGGPCMFFGAFKQTRFVFYAWVRAMLNYGLLVIFVSMIMAMCIYGMNVAIDSLAATDVVDGILTLEFAATLCWGALTVGMLLKAPDFAAAISGGSAGSTSGIAGGIAAVGGAMVAGGVAMGQSKMSKAGGQLGKDAASGMVNRISGGRVGRAFSDRKGVDR
jgi:hypothetical protein